MSYDKLFGLEIDHRVSASNPAEISMNCPFCVEKGKSPDVKRHLYFNVSKLVFHCHRCGTAGTHKRLRDYIDVGVAPELKNFTGLRTKLVKLFAPKAHSHYDLESISWPCESRHAPIAYEYMRKRGFTDAELSRFQVRVGRTFLDHKTDRVVRRYAGRVIFPFIEDGKVTYLVARTIGQDEPKYLNSPGDKSSVVFGLDDVRGTAIVCEGIISAIAANRVTGVPAVCVLGKSPSDYQIAKLRNRADTVYTSLDGTSDVTPQERSKFNRKFIKAGFRVFEVKLPAGDPDELGKEYVKYFKRAQRVLL